MSSPHLSAEREPYDTPSTSTDTNDRLVPAREAERLCGISRSTVYKLQAQGKFPEPVRITARLRRFRLGDLRRWLKDRIAERDARLHKPAPRHANLQNQDQIKAHAPYKPRKGAKARKRLER